MLKNIIPKWLNGLTVGVVLFSNTLLWGCIVLALGLIKLVLPMVWVSNLLHSAYQGWCSGNRLGLKLSNAEIMDHLLAVLPIFDLRPYQSVTGQFSPAPINPTGIKPTIKVANNTEVDPQ